MKLADALLRRKELQLKVNQIAQIKHDNLYDVKMERRQISESVDDIIAKVPVVTLSQVTEEYDYYSKQLRLIDAAIQQLNWTTDINVDSKVWMDYAESKK